MGCPCKGDHIRLRVNDGLDVVLYSGMYKGYYEIGADTFIRLEMDEGEVDISTARVVSIFNESLNLRECAELLRQVEKSDAETGERLQTLKKILRYLEVLEPFPDSAKRKRVCAYCNKRKDVSAFPLVRKSDGPDGRRRSYCETCWPKYQRDYRNTKSARKRK